MYCLIFGEKVRPKTNQKVEKMHKKMVWNITNFERPAPKLMVCPQFMLFSGQSLSTQ